MNFGGKKWLAETQQANIQNGGIEMRNAIKWSIGAILVAAALMMVAPNQADAHPYGYYGPRYYRPVPVRHYHPRHYAYRAPYRAYYAPRYVARPYYGGVYYGGPRVSVGICY